MEEKKEIFDYQTHTDKGYIPCMHKGYISNNEMQQIYTQNDVSLSYKSDTFFLHIKKRKQHILLYLHNT